MLLNSLFKFIIFIICMRSISKLYSINRNYYYGKTFIVRNGTELFCINKIPFNNNDLYDDRYFCYITWVGGNNMVIMEWDIVFSRFNNGEWVIV
jgi:hypothetical protein